MEIWALIQAFKIISGNEALQLERFLVIAPNKATRGHSHTGIHNRPFMKPKGALKQTFFSARCVLCLII